MSRFKVGDRVRLKANVEIDKQYDGITLYEDIAFDNIKEIEKIDTGDSTVLIDDYWYGMSAIEKADKLDNKEEKTMELLKIYVDRKIKKIKEEKEQKIEDLLKRDEIYKKVQAFEKELNEQYNTHTNLTLIHGNRTEETNKKLGELEEAENTAIIELDRKIEEVEAQLKLCETYEQKIDILASYDIINKKTKALNV